MKKRIVSILTAIGFGSALTMALFLLLADPSASAASAAELRVCPSGCTYSTIQSAVDAAQTGNIVKVAEGTYTGVQVRDGITQVVYISNSITVRGGYATTDWSTSDPEKHPTIIDAQNQGRVLAIVGTNITPIVEGLQITGGMTPDPYIRGGGIYIYNADAMIQNNVIFSNTTEYYGAGIYVAQSDATIRDNAIINNGYEGLIGAGGGIYQDYGSPVIENNAIIDNESRGGGGMLLFRGSPTIVGNTIIGNRAASGGGIELVGGTALIEDNLIKENLGSTGSALHLYECDATFVNNVMIDNIASWRGAIVVTEGSTPRFIHNTIARNGKFQGYGTGSGIIVTDYLSEPGIGTPSTIVMTNTILVSHTVGVTVTAGSTATFNATLWHDNGVNRHGNVIHTNDYAGDPQFSDDGYHLSSQSIAIDKGINAGISRDIDGDARPKHNGYDIGADEYFARLFLPAVLTD